MRFYVYELWDSIKNEPFYVGKGQHYRGKMRHEEHLKIALGIKTCHDPNGHKINRINKILRLGGKIQTKIVLWTDDETEAFNKEKELIKQYGRRNLETGCLTNLTDGGDGISGRVVSKEERERISRQVRGTGNPMYGKHHTEEAKRKITEMNRRRIANGYVFKHTEEWKTHLRQRQFNPGVLYSSLPVLQIDLLGNIVATFESVSQAAKQIGYSKGSLHSALTNSHRCKGYYWRYPSSPDLADGKLIRIKEFNKINEIHRTGKPILQCDLNGTPIRTWASAVQIKEELDIPYTTIIAALQRADRNPVSRGFIWKLAEMDK